MAIKHYELEDPNVWNVASHNWMVSNIYIDGNRWRCIPYLLQPITRKAPSKGFPPQYLPQLQNTFWSCMLGELTGSGWLPGNVSSYHRPTTSSIPPTCEFANKPGTRRHRGSMQNIPAAGTLFVASMPINQLEGHFLVCLSSLTHTQAHNQAN